MKQKDKREGKNSIRTFFLGYPKAAMSYISFSMLLAVYLLHNGMEWIVNNRLLPPFIRNPLHAAVERIYLRLVSFNRRSQVTINRINLIDLAIKNMIAKKTRTFITVGGMAVGVGAIVLLQSIGYGLQELVISRVARLEELKQINVSPQIGSNTKLTEESISLFNKIPHVEKSLPQIAIVGRVTYENSNSDIAVYGVTRSYLEESAIKMTVGSSFESDVFSTPTEEIVLAEKTDTVDITEIDPTATQEEIVSILPLSNTAVKEAVINKAFLDSLGLTEDTAIGKTFEVSFIVVGSLLNSIDERIETIPTTYTVVGVSAENDSPFFYVPFIDLRGIGIANFSQIKVIVDDEVNVPTVRQHIEAQGFMTTSVIDTVSQIDSLFGTLRLVLAIVGFVAVIIAALGMFNTLTVSLLERTREVGFMKAMGMKSHEIKDLFLTESLLMGIFGGLSGLLFGAIGGLMINIILSIFSWSQGGGYIDVSYIPNSLILVIGLLSLFVGIFTGLYPARRATKISALNALRYE